MTVFCKAKAKPLWLRGILTGRPLRGLPLAAVRQGQPGERMTAFCKAKAEPPRLRGILTGRPLRGLPLAAVRPRTARGENDGLLQSKSEAAPASRHSHRKTAPRASAPRHQRGGDRRTVQEPAVIKDLSKGPGFPGPFLHPFPGGAAREKGSSFWPGTVLQ